MSKNTAKKSESESSPDVAALAAKLEALMAEQEKLRAENAKLRMEKESGLTLKTSKYGALQINGLRQGYVGFYRDEWEKLLAMAPRIQEYLDNYTAEESDLPGGPGTDGGEFAVLGKHESYQHFPADSRKQ